MPLLLQASVEFQPIDYVNTLVGTQSSHALSAGNTYPAVARPWGMNAWTPQTGRMGDGWTYTYDATLIRGIRLTHQPSPWINDYGCLSLMPISGTAVFDQDERASHFSHKAEQATPYYYRVYLADHNITAELAPTCRAAIMRATYHSADSAFIVIDAMDGGSHVNVDPERRTITGYTTKNSGGVPSNFRLHFVITFSHDIVFAQTYSDGRLTDTLSTTANHTGAIVGFDTRAGEQVTMRIAASFVSLEQAERNLRELSDHTLDEVAAEGRSEWNEALSRILVESDDIDHLRTFYSCLYRSLLFPRAFYEFDANHQPIHYSPYDGQVHSGYMFTDTGFWDTFRALFPLLNLVYPDVASMIQLSLENTYRESGFLPEWASPGHRDCMVGNNSASVIADAYLSGIRGQDIELLWQALTHGANACHPTISSTGRAGYQHYNRLGYVPCDVGINESAARTLEYAYDDWCILQLGRALGKSESELVPYAQHALNYRNLFDSGHRLMRGRNSDGTWQTPYNPLAWGGAFTEGNAWHYTWSVFHDPEGLARLMGGEQAMASMLDSVFALPPTFDASYYGYVIHEIREMQIMGMGNYAHGNQPIQHMIYLYNWVGQPWKTQHWTREVIDHLYTPTPDGYCGDEDNGQTSAWYVFSSLGFYPVCPGSGQYALSAPTFKRAIIRVPSHQQAVASTEQEILPRQQEIVTVEQEIVTDQQATERYIVINAPLASSTCRYIDSLRINGQTVERNYITLSELSHHAVLDFVMSTQPNLTRGTSPHHRPYSLSE